MVFCMPRQVTYPCNPAHGVLGQKDQEFKPILNYVRPSQNKKLKKIFNEEKEEEKK